MTTATKIYKSVKAKLHPRQLAIEAREYYNRGLDAALYRMSVKKNLGGFGSPVSITGVHAMAMTREERTKLLMSMPKEDLVEDFSTLLASTKLLNSLSKRAMSRYRDSLAYRQRGYFCSSYLHADYIDLESVRTLSNLPVSIVKDFAKVTGRLTLRFQSLKSKLGKL